MRTDGSNPEIDALRARLTEAHARNRELWVRVQELEMKNEQLKELTDKQIEALEMFCEATNV